MSLPTVREVLLTARVLPFFVTQLLTAFNDNLFKNAIAMLVTLKVAGHAMHDGGGPAIALGLGAAQLIFLSQAVFILPFFFFSAGAGQLADKVDKSRIIRAVKVAEVAIMAVAAAGFVADSIPLLLVALAAMGVHSAFLGPVKYGILPELLPANALVLGNAWVELGTFLAILVGTIGGGALVAELSPTYAGIAVLVVAAVGVVPAFQIPKLAPQSPDTSFSLSPFGPTREVLRIAARKRSILHTVMAISWFWFVGTCLMSLFHLYATESLGGSPEVVQGMLVTFCVGIALGSVLTERISGANLELALVPIGALGISLGLFHLAYVGEHPSDVPRGLSEFAALPFGRRVLVDLALVALSGGLFTVPLYAFLAKRAEPSERARVVAANNVLNALFMVLATVMLMGLDAMGLSRPQIFGVLGVLNLAVAIYVESVVPEYVLRFVAFVLSRVMYRLRVHGVANLPADGPALVVCNHVSFIDWLVLGGSIPRPARFVMDHRIAKWPFARVIFERGNAIPIAPAKEDEGAMEAAFDRIAAELRDGEIVCIFPEGRLTPDGRIAPFKKGVERILRETPVPVIPCALDGLWGSMFSRRDGPAMSRPPRRFRARLRLTIGEPIAPGSLDAAQLEARVGELLASEPRLDSFPPG